MKLASNKKAVLVLAALLAMLPPPAEGAELSDLLREAGREGVYRQADEKELRRAEELFVRTLRGEATAVLKKGWSELNFELLEVSDRNQEFTLLREQGAHRTGRGFYLLRRGAGPILLQMPHSFKDEQTRRIGLDLVLEGRSLAAAWNTVPRWYHREGRRVDADLAHLPESYFTALTRAFLRTAPDGVVAQLHGFQAESRKSSSGAGAGIIISSGRKSVTGAVRKAAACLEKGSGTRVLVYPTYVRELGGTTNTVGRLMGELGSDGFIHLELSGEFRSRLQREPRLRANLNRCLEEATR